jgi:hypothetical protein
MKRLKTIPWSVSLLLGALAGVALWALLPRGIAAAEPKNDQHPEAAEEEHKIDPWMERNVNVHGKAGPFTVTVDRVRWDFGQGMSLGMSGFPMIGGNRMLNSDRKNTERGTFGTMTGSITNGISGAFMRPNLLLDVEVKGPKYLGKRQLLCTVNGKVTGEDDQGRPVESPDLLGSQRLKLPGVIYREGEGRTTIHLFVPQAMPKAKSLRFVQGELLLAQGTVAELTFVGDELLQSATKRAGGVSIRLEKISQTQEGIDVTLAASPSTAMRRARNPLEHLQEMMGSQGRINAVLEDTQGGIHSVADSSKTVQLGNGMTVTTSGGGSGMTMSSQGMSWSGSDDRGGLTTYENWPSQDFHFDPLPEGVKIKAIRCAVTDRIGEPKTVSFRLENIPLPGPDTK